ncbi:Inner membrane protein YgaP [Phycisphaerales bacterium]|nr:Inner membrane protein YgaP [Phycisphaerales bacterium]
MGAGVLLQRAMAIALIGVVGGAAHSYFGGQAKFRQAAPATNPDTPPLPGVPQPPPESPGPGAEISVAQAWDLFQKGSPFVDARLVEDYEKGHVEGAFWITADQFMNGNFPAALNFIDKSATVVVYCSGGDCDASHNVVELMHTVGYTQCHVMKDGFDPWKSAGHPVAAGKPEIGGG